MSSFLFAALKTRLSHCIYVYLYEKKGLFLSRSYKLVHSEKKKQRRAFNKKRKLNFWVYASSRGGVGEAGQKQQQQKRRVFFLQKKKSRGHGGSLLRCFSLSCV
eukprot:GEMP01017284.1.p2 GENE.GEMP01017284.1~~GEMP01017284.1.p2  ORF type:complete len:104 (-),score=4.46 GEMP01017284.1:743-1054(-)